MTAADPQVLDALLALFCLGCVVTDVRDYKIYNRWTFPFMAIGLLLGAAGGLTPLPDAAQGLALGFGVILPFYAAGGVAAGDSKMMMAIGALRGWRFVAETFVAMGLAYGLLSMGVIAYDCRRLGWAQYLALTQVEAQTGVTYKESKRTKAPVGVAIAAGALVARVAPLLGW